MYLKLSGCFLILFSSMLLGYSFKLHSKRTLAAYENLLLCMQVFERDINHCSHDILAIATQVTDIAIDANLLLFENFLSRAKEGDGKPLSAIWKDSVYDCAKQWCYSQEDTDIFLDFGSILGSGDADTQLKNIHRFCDKVNERMSYFKNNKNKTDEVLAKLGIYIGILLIIFLI